MPLGPDRDIGLGRFRAGSSCPGNGDNVVIFWFIPAGDQGGRQGVDHSAGLPECFFHRGIIA